MSLLTAPRVAASDAASCGSGCSPCSPSSSSGWSRGPPPPPPPGAARPPCERRCGSRFCSIGRPPTVRLEPSNEPAAAAGRGGTPPLLIAAAAAATAARQCSSACSVDADIGPWCSPRIHGTLPSRSPERCDGGGKPCIPEGPKDEVRTDRPPSEGGAPPAHPWPPPPKSSLRPPSPSLLLAAHSLGGQSPEGQSLVASWPAEVDRIMGSPPSLDALLAPDGLDGGGGSPSRSWSSRARMPSRMPSLKEVLPQQGCSRPPQRR